MKRAIRQRASHADLLCDASAKPTTSRPSRLDAIIVPTSRPASSLRRVISLSGRLSVPLLVFCSGRANPEQVVERVVQTPGARALVVDVNGYTPPYLPLSTSPDRFPGVNGKRDSDLSLKRNLGLMVAKMRRWRKVLLLDDDITHVRLEDIYRLSHQLERNEVAGMVCREFPDNSVTCHARRLAGLPQDNFVSGAALGINVVDRPPTFFPDIYNEDWFFFAESAASRRLTKVGEARQEPYDPYDDPERAAGEEFGDLLAEGLYALFAGTRGWAFKEQISAAAPRYWDVFIDVRRENLEETVTRLRQSVMIEAADSQPLLRAIKSVQRAREQLELISPDTCQNFLEAWQADLSSWEQVWKGPLFGGRSPLSERDVFDELGLKRWTSCEFASSDLMRTPMPRELSAVSASR